MKLHFFKITMDRSLTSTSKSTPFSINDILTKNNTTIFRRSNSTEHLSPINQKQAIDSQFDRDQMDESSDDLSKHLSNSMRFFKYMPPDHDSALIEAQSSSRAAPQSYLCNNNSLNNNNNNQKNFISANEVKLKRNGHSDKSIKSLRFYNFPVMLERPIDMRRCAVDDDSGKFEFTSKLNSHFYLDKKKTRK